MTYNALEDVKQYWEEGSCGEHLYLTGSDAEDYDRQAAERYRIEPCIPEFAEFGDYAGKKVLEIGVGLGADHQQFAQAGADLTGVDLTQRAIDHVQRRFAGHGLSSSLRRGSAENLAHLDDDTFDLVYSWGVVHCTPDTPRAVREVLRVLKPSGEAKIMIYSKYSFVGYMLWLRYALARGKPRTSLAEIYDRHLESPGTKAYTPGEARQLFAGAGFDHIRVETLLTHADLLTSPVGQRHRGRVLSTARALWPRPLIRTLFPRHGLFLLVRATKPQA